MGLVRFLVWKSHLGAFLLYQPVASFGAFSSGFVGFVPFSAAWVQDTIPF